MVGKNGTAPANGDKTYEVFHDIRLGKGKDVFTRSRGETVKASDFESIDDITALLEIGVLRDPEAPATGATTDLAHDRLTSIAQKLGLVAVKGSEYSLGTKKAKGVTAFRDAVSLDDLETAILSAVATARNESASLREQLESAQEELAAKDAK